LSGRKLKGFLVPFLLLFFLFFIFGCQLPPQAPPEDGGVEGVLQGLEVHFLDVGQGDSIFIQTAEQNILIDAGEKSQGEMVVDYLRGQGVEKLDLVIATHPHSDHIGGLIQVLTDIPVKEVLDPAVVHTTKLFEDYLTLIAAKDIKFTEGRAGMVRDLGGAVLEILHPLAPTSSALNDASLVTRITCGHISLLLTGDIEKKSEREILDRGVPIKSTLLKACHHGSSTSNSPQFVQAVAPEAVIIMCGEGNDYGHPHEEVLETYSRLGVAIYRTDLLGSIVVSSDGETYTIAGEKGAGPAENYYEPDFELLGSVNSNRYHRPDCRHIADIKAENIIIFQSRKDAEARGYIPCKTCKPVG